jgi:hypothetical protein
MGARARTVVAWALASATALVALVFVVVAFARRPYNPVEAELSFEALRVARGHPLYVDPRVGAWEAGAPASRYYVLYTPLWPWLVARLGGETLDGIRAAGRAVSAAAWAVALLAPVTWPTRDRRRDVALAALLAAGLVFLARNVPAGTPDTLAAALACVAMVRAARRDRFDAVSASLLVLAPFVKPSSVGALAGASIALVATRPERLRAITAGAATALGLAAACHAASGGQWIDHLVRSTAQPLSFERWLDETGSRFFVLGLPHGALALVALRRRASPVVLAPFVGSLAWTTFSMAKNGSGTHYWLEPTALALVVLGALPAYPGSVASRVPAIALGAAIAIVSVPAFVRDARTWRDRADAIAAIDRHCVRDEGDIVMSTDVELELILDGRILVPEWQSSFLVHVGRFPVEGWRDALRDDRVKYVALAFDPHEPLHRRLGDDQVSAYRWELLDVLDREFELDDRVAGMVVYRRRARALSTAP